MRCERKKPESCYTCTLPDCLDAGNRAPEKGETEILNEFIPDRKIHRTDKRRMNERMDDTPDDM